MRSHDRDDDLARDSGSDDGALKWTIGPVITSCDKQPPPHQLPKSRILCGRIEAFIGISIAMGVLRLPRVKDYWSTSNVLSNPWFRSIMSRDRFLEILRYIHLVDSSQQKKKGERGFDPLFKTGAHNRPLVDHLNAVFPECYKASRYLSIDEMMIGTRCRVAFLQYIPQKLTRFGIKVWINLEAKTGYVLCFQVYTGATGSENGKTETTGLGYRVVMDLMERYRMKAHCLFVDNFYTSPQLLNDLLVAGTYCTGTARSNRKDFPKEIVPTESNLPSGYSGKIVGFITMPVKNNVEIYMHLFRPFVQQYGMWDQFCVDQGKEWYLMLFVQEQLAHLRYNTSRAPHLQTTSKKNHSVERMWVEINGRVNYPIKACLVAMQERQDIDLDGPHQCYCISWFTIRVANVGTALAVESWNNHPIPGAHWGIPNDLMRRNSQTVPVDPQLLPEPDDAIQQFELYGGHLTLFSPFDHDPLWDRADLFSQREAECSGRYPEFGQFFYTVVNGDYSFFLDGLLYLIEISHRLESQL